jgi:hypothetical protein
MVPLPVTLFIILYWRGRYHKLLNVSYFVEDGSMRQLRLTIGRLPIMPSVSRIPRSLLSHSLESPLELAQLL